MDSKVDSWAAVIVLVVVNTPGACRPACRWPLGTEAVDEMLQRRGHVAEARRAAEQQAGALGQVLAFDVGAPSAGTGAAMRFP